MAVIVHQRPRVHPPSRPLTGLRESLHKHLPVVVLVHDWIPAIPPRHYVIVRALKLDPVAPRHELSLGSSVRETNEK